MKRLVVLVLFSAIALALPSAAKAATITLTSFAVTAHTVNSTGLVITNSPIQATPYQINFGVGSPHAVDLFNIGTSEPSVGIFTDTQDTTNRPISVAMTFSPPATGPNVSGTTNGFYNLLSSSCGLFAGGCGQVNWTAPSIFNFGTTGQFRVDLANVQFGTPGSTPVLATFTLLSEDVAPVPEPASMILLGTGLLYGAQRRWRKKA